MFKPPPLVADRHDACTVGINQDARFYETAMLIFERRQRRPVCSLPE